MAAVKMRVADESDQQFEKKYCFLPKQSLFLPRLQTLNSYRLDTWCHQRQLQVQSPLVKYLLGRPISSKIFPISNKYPGFNSLYEAKPLYHLRIYPLA